MNFIRCKQADSDYQPLLDYAASEGAAIIDSIVINNIPTDGKCRILGNGYKEHFAVTDGSLEVTFEYAGHYEILITGTNYKERIHCEAAPFDTV